MKPINKLIFALTAALLLTGCARTVDQMYCLPKRSDAYNNLQSSIDSAMTGLEYCAPLSGENRQTVQMADLDGDGIDEYLLFAKSNQEERPLRIFVFRKIDGSFENVDAVECNGTAFDLIEYVDMNGDGGMEIVAGRQLSDQVIRSVSVYAYHSGELEQMVTANYTKFLTVDLNADGFGELFLLRPGLTETDNGVAELYSMRNGVMERYNEVNMSQPVDKLKRILVGKLEGGQDAVYTACTVGDTALVTDAYTLRDGLLTNVSFSNESGTGVQTIRNFYVYADDIDNDLVVELPFLIEMKPLADAQTSDNNQLIRWYAMTPDGVEVDKMYTYHNFVGGWYMQLSGDWAQRVSVTTYGSHFIFYVWDSAYLTCEKFLTIYALSGQNRVEQSRESNRFMLLETDSVVYSAALESNAEVYGIDAGTVKKCFCLIHEDWKTGET